jgi:hypothetical protein
MGGIRPVTEGLAITILISLLALLVVVGVITNAWHSHDEPRQRRRSGLLDR